MANIWCTVKEWKKHKTGTKYSGIAKPEDPALFDVFQYVLITEEMLKRSGVSGITLEVGDRIEVDVIVYSYRLFGHEPRKAKV